MCQQHDKHVSAFYLVEFSVSHCAQHLMQKLTFYSLMMSIAVSCGVGVVRSCGAHSSVGPVLLLSLQTYRYRAGRRD